MRLCLRKLRRFWLGPRLSALLRFHGDLVASLKFNRGGTREQKAFMAYCILMISVTSQPPCIHPVSLCLVQQRLHVPLELWTRLGS